MIRAAFERRFDRPVLAAIIAVTTVALLARVVLLGDRIAHFDEGRVAYGALRYSKTGAWSYDPSVHGPFLFHVNKVVFGTIGPSDFSSRLVVALVGGLLPATAWLFRERLRDAELVALALFFAFDPILLYYSRFMRNDVLVAGFSIAGLGLLVRLLDTRKAGYLYAGALSFALAFTTKENAILYPVTILGALVLLFDHRLFLARAHENDGGWFGYGLSRLRSVADGVWRWKHHLLLSGLLFVGVFAFFYAPRLAPVGGPGLWAALGDPARLQGVLEDATLGVVDQIRSVWLSGSLRDHAYQPYLQFYLRRLANASGALSAFALLGFVVDRYAGDRPNDLVSLGFYAGVVSVFGYPAAMSVQGAWAVSHALVFLAFPAAAGAATIYRRGRTVSGRGDRVGATLAAIVLLLAGGYTAGIAVHTSYVSPQDNGLVQYAQPEGDMRPAIRAAQDAARENEGLDVLWVGRHFYVEDESGAYRLGVPDGEWYSRLPVPWYLEIPNATIDSVPGIEANPDALGDPPPVVITCRNLPACPSRTERADLEAQLGSYERFPPYEARYLPDRPGMEFVFYVRESYVDG